VRPDKLEGANLGDFSSVKQPPVAAIDVLKPQSLPAHDVYLVDLLDEAAAAVRFSANHIRGV
jgi:hypothetical protein